MWFGEDFEIGGIPPAFPSTQVNKFYEKSVVQRIREPKPHELTRRMEIDFSPMKIMTTTRLHCFIHPHIHITLWRVWRNEKCPILLSSQNQKREETAAAE